MVVRVGVVHRCETKGFDGGNPVESWLGLKHTVSRPAVVEIPAVAVRIETFPRVLVS